MANNADRPSRDDLTVEVIFFGEGKEAPAITSADRVTVNVEATAKLSEDLKAKI